MHICLTNDNLLLSLLLYLVILPTQFHHQLLQYQNPNLNQLMMLMYVPFDSLHTTSRMVISVENGHCYIAGNVSQQSMISLVTSRSWNLTIKLSLSKISEWGTLQNPWCQRVTVHCYPQMLTDDGCCSEV